MVQGRRVVGIDVSKETLHVYNSESKKSLSVANNMKAVKKLVVSLKKISPELIVFEPTGGYEEHLVLALKKMLLPSHLANVNQVHSFAQMRGQHAKTDSLDAILLSKYGQEVHVAAQELPSEKTYILRELTSRLAQVKKIITCEKNRSQHDFIAKDLSRSHHRHLKFLETEVKVIERKIDQIIDELSSCTALQNKLKEVTGVGEKVSRVVVTLLPELGKLNRQQITRLVGVSPCVKQSGKKNSSQAPRGGRAYVRQMLFVAAMSATKHNPILREYYQGLLARGKEKMVAMIAAVRKLVIYLNSLAAKYYEQSGNLI